MRCLSKPETYRGFSIKFDVQVGVCFTDGQTEWAARSYRHARERIDAIVSEREARALQKSGQLPLF